MRLIDADALIMALRLEYPMMPMFKENQKEWGIKTEGYRKAEEVIKDAPTIEPKAKVIAQVTFDEEKMREIVKEAVERFKEEYEIEPKRGEWVPCSEKLPEISGAYLVWVKWPYEEYPSWSIINYDADCEAFGEWQEHYHPDTLGYLDSEFVEIKDVYAWMPLPEPYCKESE